LRYVDNTFTEEVGKTTGFEYKIKLVPYKGETAKLRICDSVGEERFSALTASFFRGCHAVLFVCDITNVESAQNLKRWFAEVDRYVDAKCT
jgi:small GTP-binding protein